MMEHQISRKVDNEMENGISAQASGEFKVGFSGFGGKGFKVKSVEFCGLGIFRALFWGLRGCNTAWQVQRPCKERKRIVYKV